MCEGFCLFGRVEAEKEKGPLLDIATGEEVNAYVQTTNWHTHYALRNSGKKLRGLMVQQLDADRFAATRISSAAASRADAKNSAGLEEPLLRPATADTDPRFTRTKTGKIDENEKLMALAARNFVTQQVKEHEDKSIIAQRENVIRAFYGDSERTRGTDVTEKVKEMLAGGISVTASSDHFGDPLPGTRKVLSVDIYLQRQFVTYQLEEHTGKSINIQPEKVIRAFYGDPQRTRGKDVTEKVKELLASGLSVVASNLLFGDPLPGGPRKVLFVDRRKDAKDRWGDLRDHFQKGTFRYSHVYYYRIGVDRGTFIPHGGEAREKTMDELPEWFRDNDAFNVCKDGVCCYVENREQPGVVFNICSIAAWRYVAVGTACLWMFWLVFPGIAYMTSTCGEDDNLAKTAAWIWVFFAALLPGVLWCEWQAYKRIFPVWVRFLGRYEVLGHKVGVAKMAYGLACTSALLHTDMATQGLMLGKLSSTSQCESNQVNQLWDYIFSKSAVPWMPEMNVVALSIWCCMSLQLMLAIGFGVPFRDAHKGEKKAYADIERYTISSLMRQTSPPKQFAVRNQFAFGAVWRTFLGGECTMPNRSLKALAEAGRMNMLSFCDHSFMQKAYTYNSEEIEESIDVKNVKKLIEKGRFENQNKPAESPFLKQLKKEAKKHAIEAKEAVKAQWKQVGKPFKDGFNSMKPAFDSMVQSEPPATDKGISFGKVFAAHQKQAGGAIRMFKYTEVLASYVIQGTLRSCLVLMFQASPTLQLQGTLLGVAKMTMLGSSNCTLDFCSWFPTICKWFPTKFEGLELPTLFEGIDPTVAISILLSLFSALYNLGNAAQAAYLNCVMLWNLDKECQDCELDKKMTQADVTELRSKRKWRNAAVISVMAFAMLAMLVTFASIIYTFIKIYHVFTCPLGPWNIGSGCVAEYPTWWSKVDENTGCAK